MTVAPGAPSPQLTRHDRLLVWAVPQDWSAISSAAVGGGLVRPRWVLNAGVDETFARTDLDVWAAEVTSSLGLAGPGCALLTAADVSRVEHARRNDVDCWATVGVTKPTWPHDRRAGLPSPDGHRAPPPGTVNIVVALPVPLTPSALVQAVGTVTEAKAQVLVGAGVPGTGTASDAVVVLCPGAADEEEKVPFAGVRAPWGRSIAHAVHDAVLAGLSAHPWTGPGTGTGTASDAGTADGQAVVW